MDDAGTTILVSTHYMDEAERCHRLTILNRGRLVADGSPAELTGKLEGRTLLVESGRQRIARNLLLNLRGVISAAQIGNSLQLLTTGDQVSAEEMREALRAEGIRAQIAPVTPSLEDVFVAVTHRDSDPEPVQRTSARDENSRTAGACLRYCRRSSGRWVGTA